MADWELYRASGVPDGIRDRNLFASAGWAWVLEGLGCETWIARLPGHELAAAIPVFRRGPLKIGFLGLPVAGDKFDGLEEIDFVRHANDIGRALGLHMVRATRSVLVPEQGGRRISLPEARIDDLPAWTESRSKRLARDLAFSRRACASLRFEDNAADGAGIHRLYLQAVRAHGGKARYTADYFRRLIGLAGRDSRLLVVHATDPQGASAGFAALAMDGRTGYYLHAAVAQDARSLGLGDLLLARLVSHAQASGLARFTMMASPAGQAGLAAFKRKWAQDACWAVTHDVGMAWPGRAISAALAWRARRATTREDRV